MTRMFCPNAWNNHLKTNFDCFTLLTMSRPGGELKRAVLDALGDGHWHYAQEIAQACLFRPTHSFPSYMARLAAQGLVERGHDPQGALGYRLSPLGCREALLRASRAAPTTSSTPTSACATTSQTTNP